MALWVAACCMLMLCSSFSGVEGIGVSYGMIANNLPSPDKVIALYKSRNITDVRLYHPDTTVLEALRGSGLGVVLGTLNEDLARLASDPSFAASWVALYVAPFAGAVRFRYITAGNEIIPGPYAAQVLPAMHNLEAALRSVGLAAPPVVTTSVATSVLGASYPPSQGTFSEAALPAVGPIASFLASRSAPLLVNVYPYFAYAADPATVRLDYALLSAAGGTEAVVTDGGVAYGNMFDAILDAVHAALEKAGAPGVEVVVSETGWPSGGGGLGASVENAAAYMNNVVRHVGHGTPRRPGKAVETYLFAMFNENQKPEGIEQNFGLFRPDMTEVYHVDFAAAAGASC
ncbi:hypothetical protein PR202_ga09343 [Eleusine coracana subsp. coracana]|uniref:Uncharacterized protein n=1 Tax=Eleusine coracana subsp. coracana TaxID=191504 RepID=A0AAV5C418_ELECO|nr:hypothetical protein QOZ80_1AG0036780 [Eleusine coracana subsp. coracana]GJM92839.1 hypothetical protein PR202_ga09343 [Eleusine coracana subsp. coracana]